MDSAPVDLRGVVDGAAEIWRHRCATAGVDFRVEAVEPAIVVFADAQRLRQALDGLLENALRVTPQGAPIVVATHTEPGGVAVLEVRDGGPGLSDDDLTVAFERSALYERYRGIRRVGTGLGLAIVHRIVERLGGTVEAGHALEGGARFTIRMPLLTPTAAPPTPEAWTGTRTHP
jgi:two-component system sensor histidine kinase BaeS